jgi:hypothetical protein
MVPLYPQVAIRPPSIPIPGRGANFWLWDPDDPSPPRQNQPTEIPWSRFHNQGEKEKSGSVTVRSNTGLPFSNRRDTVALSGRAKTFPEYFKTTHLILGLYTMRQIALGSILSPTNPSEHTRIMETCRTPAELEHHDSRSDL